MTHNSPEECSPATSPPRTSRRNAPAEQWYEPGKNRWRITYTFDEAQHEQQKLIKHFRTPPLTSRSLKKLADALEKCAPNNRCLKQQCVLCSRARQRVYAAKVYNHG